LIFVPFLDTLIDTYIKPNEKGAKIKTLHEALTTYLEVHHTDEKIIELFQRIRALQSNGYQIKDAILKAIENDPTKIETHIPLSQFHKDNIPAYLATKHRAKLIKFKAEGHGYGKIAKLLKQRNIYNKQTGKAYSRSTIKRALELIEKGRKNDLY
jgi:type II secretory pathway component PulC